MPDATRASVKKVSLQERSLPVGNIVGINGYRVNRATLRKSIEDEGYVIHETPHFFVVIRSMFPSVIVIHWFAPAEIDARIGDYILQELQPLGVLTDVEDFDAVFGAVIGSLFPHEAQQAWSLYTTNTFQHLRNLTYRTSPLSLDSTPHTFATLYRRVFALQVGTSFLDAGCSSGFLPLLIAEHVPSLIHVVGIDIRPHPFATAQALAEEHGLKHVQFIQADLLDNTLYTLGSFDTITLLHVLEHFPEKAMYTVLTNLLAITGQRLIIAVPYEYGTPEKAYGHEQLFSREKLEAVGRWCLQQWHKQGTMRYEDCADGLLVLERTR
jgi:protein-L-isoaspartate O-methyltransferase